MTNLLEAFKRTFRLFNQFSVQEQRLVVKSFVVGFVVFFVTFSLKEAVHWLFEATIHFLESGPTVFILFGPLCLGALIVAALARFQSKKLHYTDDDGHIHELIDVEGDGLERAISLYFSSEPSFERALTGEEGVDARWRLPTFSLAIRKWVATLATLGSGGSGGLEASVTLIGESMAAGLFKPRHTIIAAKQRVGLIGRFWRWWSSTDTDELQTMQMCGIAAAVSTLLGAPFAAAFFASEVMYRRRPIIEKLVFALIAALTAFFLNNFMSGDPLFEIGQHAPPPTESRYYFVIILMGAAISVFSIIFTRLRARIDDFFHHRVTNIWQRHIIGALITGTIAILIHFSLPLLFDLNLPLFSGDLPSHRLEFVLGPGESVIDGALHGELVAGVALLILTAKLFATLITIGTGGSAGLLVPSLLFGSMIATLFATGFGYEDPILLIAPAMTASLVSIVNVPLAAILLTVEVFGSQFLVPALIILVVSSIFAQEVSIYRTQRETYDSRQIAPGYSVRRVGVPLAWDGMTLVELDLRRRFDLNVIGLLGQHDEAGQVDIRFEPPSAQPLHAADLLVVLGEDDSLDAFEAALETGVDLMEEDFSEDEPVEGEAEPPAEESYDESEHDPLVIMDEEE